VILIKGHKFHKNVSVLTEKCSACDTSYSADHKYFLHKFERAEQPKQVYFNSAKYLKLGSNL
jgi:hypothetical protein